MDELLGFITLLYSQNSSFPPKGIISYPITYYKQEKGTEKESPTILIQEVSHDNTTSYNPWNKSEALNIFFFFKSHGHKWF